MKKSDLLPLQREIKECVDAALLSRVLHSSLITSVKTFACINMHVPSYRHRFYLCDDSGDVISTHHVAHGVGSSNPKDRAYAIKFSNVNMSKCSSVGAYITSETYYGKHGRSRRLIGLDNTNDNAYTRSIVLHASEYVTDGYIRAVGRAGQSWGCPALDPAIANYIIDSLPEGSFLYVYAN